MRATHYLANGDLVGMASRNIMVPLALILLTWAWGAWCDRRLGHARVPALRPPVPVLYASVVVVVGFAVLRNLPWEPFTALAP